jgi:hypothetical protein
MDVRQKRAERLREAAISEIKAIARQQMAEQGQAALSLRPRSRLALSPERWG